MASRYCLIDFETASACDLKKAGAYRYAEDPTTEILCLGYIFAPPHEGVVLPPGRLSFELSAQGPFYQAVLDPECLFVAHNVPFEKAIWRNLMKLLGWPDIPDERWHDILAVCAMKGLPLKLKLAAKALNLAHQKDTEGTDVTLAMSKTNRKGYYAREPEKLQRVYSYNQSDLLSEREAHGALRGLGPDERRVWLLDQTINQRGVRLDLEYIQGAISICDQAASPLREEFERLTGGIAPTQDKKFKEWLTAQGCPWPRDEEGNLDTSLAKENVAKLLGVEDDEAEESLAGDEEDYCDTDQQFALPFSYRRPLQIRKILGSASVKKLPAMLACVGSDGRARGLLQYHGAGPGRWAGRLLQPQNFPRPALKDDTGTYDVEQLVQCILSRDPEVLRMCFGTQRDPSGKLVELDPIEIVASGLRHALIPGVGKAYEVGDFSKIECVIVLALAGAWETAERVIKMGSKVYTSMAEKVFGYAVTKLMLKEYTIGKNIVLGCGFQMGWRKFKKRYCPDASEDFAQGAISEYRENFAPEVPKLWRALEDAATRTVWDRVSHEAYGIVYSLEGPWLTARLPSGRRLWYYGAKPIKKRMPWSTAEAPDYRPGFEYWSRKPKGFIRTSAYGGLLTENVVQAIARDLLVNGLMNCESIGHEVVLTVHDEDINEVPEAIASAKVLEQCMTDVPEWCKALRIPVAAECWVGDRYRK